MNTQAPRYEFLNLEGRGAFGSVYRARTRGPAGFVQEVAIKVLNLDCGWDDSGAELLCDEARLLGALRHRAIVQVHELTQIDDHWAIVMEYVEGCDLGALLAFGGIPAGPALEIAAEIAGALAMAFHCPGPDGAPLRVVHRDIKPCNVRLTPFGEVKVLDFGIAHAEIGHSANTESWGTRAYMAPERLARREHGHPSDVYALGATLFELLTGVRLGNGSSQREEHLRVLAWADRAMEARGVAAPVQDLVRRMLDFDPARRPDARQVQREALRLVRQLDEEQLVEWAASRVAPLASAGLPNDLRFPGCTTYRSERAA